MRSITRFIRSKLGKRVALPRPRAPEAPLISDLLSRPMVNLDTPELQRFLADKRILVTGAGGSIGSEICRQAMKFGPRRIILLERTENSLFEIDRELRDRWVGADIAACLADVCNSRRMEQIFRDERPQVIFHCAAHKHVPMMEANPAEAIRNNVFGTITAADAALAAGAQAFVLVSTDKAVNPSSVMGATKRVAELYVQSLNAIDESATVGGDRVEAQHFDARKSASPGLSSPTFSGSCGTRFVAVRFGNVLGSSGSVVPIFQKQIDVGGPVTVTHADMRRYFMTIPEASQLVMQAGAIGKGGEVFVLDMGQPVRIVDLARELIVRNGLRPDRDILIRFTGIRPGEKLYEELACDDEQTRPTLHEKIRVWQLPAADRLQVEQGVELLGKAADGSAQDAVAALMQCVPEYRPSRQAVPMRLVLPETNRAVEAA